MGSGSFLPARIEGIRTAKTADLPTLRLCHSERDAFLASVTISGLTYDELGARLGISRQAVHKWGRGGVPHKRIRAFCNATGTLLLAQFLELERLMKQAAQGVRESDRIRAIADAARAAA
jgi:hypothetical protein